MRNEVKEIMQRIDKLFIPMVSLQYCFPGKLEAVVRYGGIQFPEVKTGDCEEVKE